MGGEAVPGGEADHRRVVGRVAHRGDGEGGATVRARVGDGGAEGAVGGDAADEGDAREAGRVEGADERGDEHLHDGGLERGGEVGAVGVEKGGAGGAARRRVEPSGGVEADADGGLDARERDVESVEAGSGEADEGGVAVCREAVDLRAAGVAEAEELADLVEGLARGVVARARRARCARRAASTRT